MIPATVLRVCDDFKYRDYTAPLGYRIVRDGYNDELAGEFASRSQVYRESERDELIARLEMLRCVIDINIDKLREAPVTA